MKTKEEIFNEYSWRELGTISPSKNFCLPAMDEWAKQKSLEFAEWKDKYFKTTYPINRKMYTLKYYEHVGETGSIFGTHYNLPELYDIFNLITP